MVTSLQRIIFRSLKQTQTKKKLTMATASFQEVLPAILGTTSEQPPLFDGTTRLYTSFICPFAQRAWITRNTKGLHEQIKLVVFDVLIRPAWYKQNVYAGDVVPVLEHKNKIIGESLDLIKYIDSNFEGPSLYPKDDPARAEFTEELFTYTKTFIPSVINSLRKDAESDDVGAPFDFLETALGKFEEGPFFLGQEFSAADIAFAPHIERYQPLALEVKGYDITQGRPKLARWIEEINKIEGYKQTKRDLNEILAPYKKRYLA